MFMLRQTSVKMAVLLHKQASDRFHSLLTVCTGGFITIGTILRGCYKVMGDLAKIFFIKKHFFTPLSVGQNFHICLGQGRGG